MALPHEESNAPGPEVGWLLEDDRVLASVEVADTARTRSKGLLGRDGIDGLLLIEPAMSIHTVGMRFAIDVAYCRRTAAPEQAIDSSEADGAASDTTFGIEVLDVVTIAPNRVGRPRPRARIVLEAEAGRFGRWGIQPGQRLQVRMPGAQV